MVYCAQAELAFSTAARRDAVLADIQARIGSRQRFGVDLLEAAQLKQGPFGIRLTVYFRARADADDLIARLESFATGARAPLAGSWVRIALSGHDEPEHGPCQIDALRAW